MYCQVVSDGHRHKPVLRVSNMKQSWKNIPGTINVGLCKFDGEWRDENDKALPEGVYTELDTLITNADARLEVSFNATGYTDSGSMYAKNGDPGYPPECDEERNLDEVTIDGTPLSLPAQRIIFGAYTEEINCVNIDLEVARAPSWQD